MKKKTYTLLCFSLLLSSTVSCAQDNPVALAPLHGDDESFAFTVQIENMSQNTDLATPLAPMAWAVFAEGNMLFTPGETANAAFESLAEDGDPEALIDGLTGALAKGHLTEPIAPGAQATFTFDAKPGSVLSFASMLVETNDVVLAPENAHLDLFDARNEPFSGTVTLKLFDAGTEVNQTPGAGADQAPRQSAANTGTAESVAIQTVTARADGFTYPAVGDAFRVTITAAHDDHEDHDHDTEAADHDHAAETEVHADDDHSAAHDEEHDHG